MLLLRGEVPEEICMEREETGKGQLDGFRGDGYDC